MLGSKAHLEPCERSSHIWWRLAFLQENADYFENDYLETAYIMALCKLSENVVTCNLEWLNLLIDECIITSNLSAGFLRQPMVDLYIDIVVVQISKNNGSSVPMAMAGHTMTLVDDIKVWVVGGFSSSSYFSESVFVYDAGSNWWTELTNIVGSRPTGWYRVLIDRHAIDWSGWMCCPICLQNSFNTGASLRFSDASDLYDATKYGKISWTEFCTSFDFQQIQ